jgi:hypothetical protein
MECSLGGHDLRKYGAWKRWRRLPKEQASLQNDDDLHTLQKQTGRRQLKKRLKRRKQHKSMRANQRRKKVEQHTLRLRKGFFIVMLGDTSDNTVFMKNIVSKGIK